MELMNISVFNKVKTITSRIVVCCSIIVLIPITATANSFYSENDILFTEDNSCSTIASGTSTLDGHELPATSGGTGYEEPINAAGQLPSGTEQVSFPQHASLGQEYQDYYIAMRWNYVDWNWNGYTVANGNGAEYTWFSEEPRIVLVTNPQNGKSIYAVALEAGPGPWTGVDANSNNDPKGSWTNPQHGTPSDYTGRVAGLPPVAFDYLEVDQTYYTDSDEVKESKKLNYQWATDQTVKPGPTNEKAANQGGSNSCLPAGGVTGLLQTVSKYAWHTYQFSINATEDYKSAISQARNEGRYVGGNSYPGIDCGGFVSLAIFDSGFDKNYNYEDKGGYTAIQREWAEANWQTLGAASSIDTSTLQAGDVNISDGHTFLYVGSDQTSLTYLGSDFGQFDGWSGVASASLDERAPCAGTERLNGDGTWYRKK